MSCNKINAFAIAIAIFLIGFTVEVDADIYNVSRTIGGGTVNGFIETDGTLGSLTAANVVDFSLTLVAANMINGPTFTLDPGNSSATTAGIGFSATSTELFFDFDNPGNNYLLFFTGGSNWYCLETGGCASGFPSETIGRDINTGSFSEIENHVGNVSFAAKIPEPSSAAVLGIGLAGLVIRRRNHTN